ncbi:MULTISPECIES: nucleoside-diphosphate kinase [Cytobacillus]|uniref:Nucleoside diphosphate kinase n=1 Tax=Cytobacillus oceanisediminis TaxID=665099 RepID=A0ABX3CK64_9BACI|nr:MULTISPECIES: nucleoside-diphosphate kinase [Cytobacillus]OHX40710.1 hypothetical protein BBV17_29095 [Cytobacillus oceanisediminis]
MDWRYFSKDKLKNDYYIKDQYFNLSQELGTSLMGSTFLEKISKFALVMIKPESFVYNKYFIALQEIQRHGFKPVYFIQKKLTRVECLELWRYQWSAASLLRTLISEKLMSYSESLIIIYEAPNNIEEFASTYLSKLKGPANESLRKEYHLRSILKPKNRMLNYIHISDEPIDVVREIGVLFEWDQQIGIYSALNHSKNTSNDELIKYIQSNNDNINKFNFSKDSYELLKEFKDDILLKSEKSLNNKEAISNIITQIDATLSNESKLDFSFFNNLKKLGLLKWNWELIFLATSFINYDSNKEKLISFDINKNSIEN